MLLRRSLFAVIAILSCAILVESCKDIGEDLPESGVPLLTASQFSVNLTPSGQITVTISGGRSPHSISVGPDTTIATVELTSLPNGTSSLLITATSTDTFARPTSVKIKEADGHGDSPLAPTHGEQEITIGITVSAAISFANRIQPIFSSSCAVPGCHVPGGSGPMSLVAGASHGNLVGATATNGPCAGDNRVDPRDADGSALIKRLRGTCGQLMPLGGPALSSTQIQLISDWINEGANNN